MISVQCLGEGSMTKSVPSCIRAGREIQGERKALNPPTPNWETTAITKIMENSNNKTNHGKENNNKNSHGKQQQ